MASTQNVQFDLEIYKKERRAQQVFPSRWGWLIEEYRLLKKKLDEIVEKSVIIEKKPKQDLRTLKPFSRTTNGDYGFVATRREFNLEKYGPDVCKPVPIPDIYKLMTNIPK